MADGSTHNAWQEEKLKETFEDAEKLAKYEDVDEMIREVYGDGDSQAHYEESVKMRNSEGEDAEGFPFEEASEGDGTEVEDPTYSSKEFAYPSGLLNNPLEEQP